jgi:hypothetical protein
VITRDRPEVELAALAEVILGLCFGSRRMNTETPAA